MRIYTSSRAKRKCFHRKSEIQMIFQTDGPLGSYTDFTLPTYLSSYNRFV